jgi:peptidoglycan/LPS O-acetylase OafA/YrhL
MFGRVVRIVIDVAAAKQESDDNTPLPNYLWIGPMARRKAFLDDLMEFGSRLPWRVAVLLAIGAFLVSYFLAITTSPPATGTAPAGLGPGLGIGAVAAYLHNRVRRDSLATHP